MPQGSQEAGKMEEGMVERVARALAQAHDYQEWDTVTVLEGQEPFEPWLMYVEDARAAIEAMREPTPQMLAETLPMTGVHCDPKTTRLAEMALHRLEPAGFGLRGHMKGLDAARALISDWYAMIDAALTPPPQEGEKT